MDYFLIKLSAYTYGKYQPKLVHNFLKRPKPYTADEKYGVATMVLSVVIPMKMFVKL